MTFHYKIQPLIDPKQRIVTASLENKDEKLATILCRWFVDSRELYIVDLQNNTRNTPEKRAGIGSTLINHVEEIMQPITTRLIADGRQGCQNNIALIKYYESLGFCFCPRFEDGETINEMFRNKINK